MALVLRLCEQKAAVHSGGHPITTNASFLQIMQLELIHAASHFNLICISHSINQTKISIYIFYRLAQMATTILMELCQQINIKLSIFLQSKYIAQDLFQFLNTGLREPGYRLQQCSVFIMQERCLAKSEQAPQQCVKLNYMTYRIHTTENIYRHYSNRMVENYI